MVRGNGHSSISPTMKNFSAMMPKTSHKLNFQALGISFPLILILCILLTILPLVHQRSFVRCYFDPDGAAQSLESLKTRIAEPAVNVPTDKISPPPHVLPSLDSAAAAAESVRLRPLQPPSPRALRESRSLERARIAELEIEPEVKDFDTAEVFKRVSSEIQLGERTVKDRGYPRTRCFSDDGKNRLFCTPSVMIAGYEKCGTSALYYKLSRHEQIVAHPFKKEFCPSENSKQGTWDWITDVHMPHLTDVTGDKLILNGCIGILTKDEALKELIRINPELKVLVALRNYADWAYSYYSYRCMPGFDKDCGKLGSRNVRGPWKKNRTPENFSDVVKDAHDNWRPHRTFGVIRPDVELYRPWLERLTKIVRRDSLLIVKQSDLSFHPRETLAEVAMFLGINNTFEDEAYSLVSNTNEKPSQMTILDKEASKEKLQTIINSASVIYPWSRKSLNLFWKGECEWLRDRFGIHFEEAC